MMAIPKNRKSISTNLPFPRLNAFLDALETEKVKYVPESSSMFAESARCKFDFEDATYSISEFLEEITSVHLVSAKPAFVLILIDELEAGLSVLVKDRSYDEAKNINRKIEDLKNLLRV